MREIKFRVFNGIEMVYDVLCGKDGCFYKNPNTEDITKYDNPEPMQYTGLEDENGVEIYEGDVLTYNGMENRKVFFKENAGAFGIDTEDYRDSKHLKFHPLFWLDIKKWEVIGNIYENKDLLETGEQDV
jgi:uncharacterized phage protein (TIGR01671 family)